MPAIAAHFTAESDAIWFQHGDPYGSLEATLSRHHRIRLQLVDTPAGQPEMHLSWLAGLVAYDFPAMVTALGFLLERSRFSVRPDRSLIEGGELRVGCVVPLDEADALRLRRLVGELVCVAGQIGRLIQLRLPTIVHWSEAEGLEVPWGELASLDLETFLEEAKRMPIHETDACSLIMAARSLCQWRRMRAMLENRRKLLPGEWFARQMFTAHYEAREWLPALRIAEQTGLARTDEDGWYGLRILHARIEAGDGSKVLPFLNLEPWASHLWLKARAHQLAGDIRRAQRAYEEFFQRYPGDWSSRVEVGF